MPGFTGFTQITSGEVYSSSATQAHRLGTLAQTRDGRQFRYAKAGAVALVPGNVIQSAAHEILWNNAAVTATAVGSTSVAVTAGAVVGAANLFAEGLMLVSTTPSLGYSHMIAGHAAIASATEFTLNLETDNPIQVALTTASKVDLIMNPYKAVIQAPVTTLTGTIVGVCVYPIAISEFGWLQVRGHGAVLIDGTTPANFSMLGSPSAAAGAACIHTAALTFVGFSMAVGVANKAKAVFINIG